MAELLDAAGIRASRRGRWHPDQLRRLWAKWLRGELRLLLPSQSPYFCRHDVPRLTCSPYQAPLLHQAGAQRRRQGHP